MSNLSNDEVYVAISTYEQSGNHVWANTFRELLAYREAAGNKVGYTWNRGINCEIVAADLYDDCPAGIDLYAAPQLPAVPPEKPHTDGLLADGWNACRAAMLKAP